MYILDYHSIWYFSLWYQQTPSSTTYLEHFSPWILWKLRHIYFFDIFWYAKNDNTRFQIRKSWKTSGSKFIVHDSDTVAKMNNCCYKTEHMHDLSRFIVVEKHGCSSRICEKQYRCRLWWVSLFTYLIFIYLFINTNTDTHNNK